MVGTHGDRQGNTTLNDSKLEFEQSYQQAAFEFSQEKYKGRVDVVSLLDTNEKELTDLINSGKYGVIIMGVVLVRF